MNVNVASYGSRSGDRLANNRGNFGSRRGGYMNRRSRGHSGRSGGWRVYCQLCGKPSHLVNRCYHRFDRSFQIVSPQNQTVVRPNSQFQPNNQF